MRRRLWAVADGVLAVAEAVCWRLACRLHRLARAIMEAELRRARRRMIKAERQYGQGAFDRDHAKALLAEIDRWCWW